MPITELTNCQVLHLMGMTSGMILCSSTILDAVLQSGSSISQAVARYEHALVTASRPNSTPQQQQVLDHCMNEVNALNGWNVKSDAQDILQKLGLPDPNSRVGGLSGGQKRRVALAAAVLAAPDLLILDEPTNHMDLGVSGIVLTSRQKCILQLHA